jgi:hypothetical protein
LLLWGQTLGKKKRGVARGKKEINSSSEWKRAKEM